MAHIAFKGQDA